MNVGMSNHPLWSDDYNKSFLINIKLDSRNEASMLFMIKLPLVGLRFPAVLILHQQPKKRPFNRKENKSIY